jgi:ubiquinol-cytochrome c reductase cytochrome b subunit
MIGRAVRFLDQRAGGRAPFLRKALRYAFPDHWSFLLGEIALYCFLVLVVTGVYLTLFFEPSLERVTYEGGYEPLRGREVSQAYASALDLSFEVKAGLLLRQTHHWAANVFLVAITLHVARVFFTGAFRKPRDLTWYVGVTMLVLAIFEGFLGYSLLDDLLSGMGLAIAYAVVLSIPVVGAYLGLALWGGEYPGAEELMSRLYVAHVLLVPIAIGALLALHLLLIVLTKHTQFAGELRTERNVVGTPLWPGYALRSAGLALVVAATLFLLGGLVQINPVWLWGPYETWLSTNGAQPDWYIGWLIGAFRLMPGYELHLFGYTLLPNPFVGGVLFPLAVFGFLYLWPTIERRRTGDTAYHHLLQRPRENPWRTAVGAAFFTWVAVVFVAGSSDRWFVWLGMPYEWSIWILRGAVFAAPALVYVLTKRLCRELLVWEALEDEKRLVTGHTG